MYGTWTERSSFHRFLEGFSLIFKCVGAVVIYALSAIVIVAILIWAFRIVL